MRDEQKRQMDKAVCSQLRELGLTLEDVVANLELVFAASEPVPYKDRDRRKGSANRGWLVCDRSLRRCRRMWIKTVHVLERNRDTEKDR